MRISNVHPSSRANVNVYAHQFLPYQPGEIAFKKRIRQIRDRLNKLPVSNKNMELLENIARQLNI